MLWVYKIWYFINRIISTFVSSSKVIETIERYLAEDSIECLLSCTNDNFESNFLSDFNGSC